MSAVLPVRIRRGPWLPGGRARINPAHPASQFLAAAIVMDAGTVYDLTGRLGKSSVFTGTPTPGAGRVGALVNFASAGFQMQSTLSGDTTCIALVMRTTTPGVGQVAVAATTEGSAASSGFEFSLGNAFGDANKVYITKWTSGSGAAVDAGWIDGVKQTGTNPCDITITNGQWYGIGWTVAGLTSGSGNLAFGGFSNGTFLSPNSSVALFLAFSKVLPDNWVAELSRDPGAILLWPEDDLWATLVGSASGTTYNDTISAAITAAEANAAALTANATVSAAATAAEALAPALTVNAAVSGAVSGAESNAAALTANATIGDGATAGEGMSGGGTVDESIDDVATMTDSMDGEIATLTARGSIRGRSRAWEDVWENVPTELQPVVSLAEHYVDLPRVEDVVTEQLARYARLSSRASLNRRMTLLEEVKRTIVAVVAQAAEDDDEETLVALI